MKHDKTMLPGQNRTQRTNALLARLCNSILTRWAALSRGSRKARNGIKQKEGSMLDYPEIPTDEEVLGVIDASPEGLTPSQLLAALEAHHSRENVIRAIQRVLDRGKVCLTDGARLVASTMDEPAYA